MTSHNLARLNQLAMAVIQYWRARWDFRQLCLAAKKPQATQHKLLKKILADNAQSEFGRAYNFASIKDYASFSKRVPIHSYEALRPYIEHQMTNCMPTHTRQMPVLYAQTSGTTGSPKRIPVLKQTLAAYKRGQRIASFVQYRDIPGLFAGKILAVVSPAIEGYLPNGTAYGAMSGVVHASLPAALRCRYVLPEEIFAIEDYAVKYRLIAAWAVAERQISVLASANPSTFIHLQQIIDQTAEQIIEFVRTGKLAALTFDPAAMHVVREFPDRPPNPTRAQELASILKATGTLSYGAIWPQLKALVTWTGGNCATFLPVLKKLLPYSVQIIEMGYLASEFRGSIIVDCQRNLGLPTIDEVFFEFIEKDAWESGKQDAKTIEQLESGYLYYVIATTRNGLYRYFINDLIEVTERFHATPCIRFVQKGSDVTNITGEKLYESQVIQAVDASCADLNIKAHFYLLLADAVNRSYTLLIETSEEFPAEHLAESLNGNLSALNQEFRDKVGSGRLNKVEIKRVRAGLYELYKQYRVKNGCREGQFKMQRLLYRDANGFRFEDYLL